MKKKKPANGVAYLIKDIDPDFWYKIQVLAAVKRRTIRSMILYGLQRQLDAAVRKDIKVSGVNEY